MTNFIPKSLNLMFHIPCSNFILNFAIQLTLSSCKVSTSAVLNSCTPGPIGTHPYVSKTSKADYSCKSNEKKLQAPWRILFFGTDEFSVKSLQLLCAKYRTNTLISKLEVVSTHSRKTSPVTQFAKDENLAIHSWPMDPDTIRDKFDIGMVVSFGHLIPSRIINSFPLGMINVHGSVLPRWRGAAPIVHALLHGDHETGISIIRVRPKHFDCGEIVRQYRCSIGPHDTAGELHERLARTGGELLVECIRDMPRCVLNAPKQPEEGATYAKKIDASYSLIDWTTMSALQVYNLHRALGHVYPLLAQWNGVNVKLHNLSLDTELVRPHVNNGAHTGHDERIPNTSNNGKNRQTMDTSSHVSSKPSSLSSALSFLSGSGVSTPKTKSSTLAGTVSFDRARRTLRIVCADGRAILCGAITVAGKKRMTAVDFNNGFVKKLDEKARRFVNLDRKLLSLEKS